VRRSGLLAAIWVGVGIWVASAHDYLDNLDRTKALGSAILAVALWPLVLLGVSLRIR
jgi:phosphotransferase system  glucose/maltose/N-acetylglucosamine-specific IIC component